ncbi:hypothetical protein QQ045_014608 [Rhodiola kirilowii]
MKLRVRSMASKDTLKIEVPSDCTLHQLKQVISDRIGSASSALTVSLNRKDELFGSPEEPLHSLGVASGDLLFYTTDSSVLVPKTLTLGAESSGSSQRVAVAFDVGMVDCGNSEAVCEANAVDDSKESRIEESEVERTQFGDAVMADVKFNETLQFEDSEVRPNDKMEVDLPEDVTVTRQSTPYFLSNLKDGQGNVLSGHSLLVATVHTILVNSDFVLLDSATGAPVYGFQVPYDRSLPAMKLSLRYTLPELIELNRAAPEFVTVNWHKLGCTLVIHGSLSGNKNRIYTVKLDESRYASKMELLLRKSSESSEDSVGSEDVFLSVLHEKEVFEFYKEVKDKLALPLLIDICDKAGFRLPPCLMLLPTELKLKIFELVSATDLAKLACQSSELRYLTSDNSLWKMKYVEKFGNVVGSNSTNWKQKFVSSWTMEKAAARNQEHDDRLYIYERWYRRRRRPRPFGTPFIIGGDYDLIPFGGAGPGTAPFGGFPNRQPTFPHAQFPPVRRFSPNCYLRGSEL